MMATLFGMMYFHHCISLAAQTVSKTNIRIEKSDMPHKDDQKYSPASLLTQLTHPSIPQPFSPTQAVGKGSNAC
jgi:hypothetical protein